MTQQRAEKDCDWGYGQDTAEGDCAYYIDKCPCTAKQQLESLPPTVWERLSMVAVRMKQGLNTLKAGINMFS